ncbi:MAG: heparan-alpha-glucosaminide N-acetyltransferase domain-containing protein [Sphingomicrobium sp.]
MNAAAAGTTESKRERLISLDMMRGLAVIGMILVNEMAGMESEGKVFPTLLHSSWAGLTLADVVFPMFLMMAGVSIPLSLGAGGRECPVDKEESKRILGRSLRLILLGFILSNLWWFADQSATSWRLFGVLQRIGLVYGACAFLFLLCSPRIRLALIAIILILYWPLTLLPSLDGLPNDIWMRGHNFVGSVDRVLLGAGNHNHVRGPEGYDPEGLLGTLPSIAHGLIGVAVGEFLARRRDGDLGRLALAGATMLVAGVLWGLVFPVIKDIWSSPFVLVTCGISILVLALLRWIFDGHSVEGARKAAAIIILPFGVNAIAAYVLHDVAGSMLGWDVLQQPYQMTRAALGDRVAALIPVSLFLLFIWLCMYYLWKKRWIIKI